MEYLDTVKESGCSQHQLMSATMANLETGMKALNDKIDKQGEAIAEIAHCLKGDYEKKGIVTVVWEHESYINAEKEECKEEKKVKRNYSEWIFKAVITAVLGYITWRIQR